MGVLNGLITTPSARTVNDSNQRLKSSEGMNGASAGEIHQVESVRVDQRVNVKESGAVAEDRQREPLISESLDQLIEDVNEQPQIKQRALQFSVHEETGQTVVRIRDTDTNEVIRQFPADEIIAMAERIHEFMGEKGTGVMLQDKA